jgi:hypothetical protein
MRQVWIFVFVPIKVFRMIGQGITRIMISKTISMMFIERMYPSQLMEGFIPLPAFAQRTLRLTGTQKSQALNLSGLLDVYAGLIKLHLQRMPQSSK